MHKFSARDILTGLLFSMLWASASVAGKFGLRVSEPLVLFTVRFLLAGLLLLAYVYGVQRNPLPRAREWKQITIFGTFNTALYLGLFIIALQYVTPGITTLAIALNPLFISIMTAVWMKRRVPAVEWTSIALGIAGVVVAAYPLLQTSHATPGGLMLLALSMLTYSFGAVYYAAVRWESTRITINAWQVFIGGLLILPLAFFMHEKENHFTVTFWLSLAWLILPVSVVAVNLWLRLLKSDAVRASLWLYLCPIFGFLYSWLLLGEPLTVYTWAGTILVMTALYIGQRKGK
ncbi:DMT family transporter [Chryseolinea lacunae]|uniref:EamA family transporter n=1 Tax=Chryseolinea lacunae TaxID=2801331 RepID=A0ABS1KNE2_9BACT|nr:DMT family transporter [Chryseolinea lacunae]MBL0740197.1 EamA family transporter [Chryseolinea lacunae]